MGDIPMEAYNGDSIPEYARIHSVAIPFCVVHAFDDPLVTWRTAAANTGLMNPKNLTNAVKTGNLMILLTKAGGHVGWPLGWLPFVDKWKWMNDVASTFVNAVHVVSRQQIVNRQCELTDDSTCTANDDNDGSTDELDSNGESETADEIAEGINEVDDVQ